MNSKIKKVEKINNRINEINKKKALIFLIIFFVIIYVLYFFVRLVSNPVSNVTIVTGKISDEQNIQAYVIRNEEVLSTNHTTDINLSLSEGSRVAKSQVVGTYVNDNIKQWEQKIKDLDVQIQKAMEEQSNLPSSDIRKIEEEIEEKVDLINNINDTQLILQYKSEIDKLIQKKAKITGELSPSGSTIKKLIEERNGYETKLNESTDYIRSTKSGVICNRVDGLEDVLTIDKLYEIKYKDLEEYKIRTDEIIPNDTKSVKIIDNYYCYLVVHIEDEHKDKIKVGSDIKIRLNYGKQDSILAQIDKIVDEGNGKTVFLKITNNVEDLIGYRKVSMDIIWWEYEGLKLPNKAIKKEEYTSNNEILERNYITLLKYGIEYKVYINVKRQNDDYCIIENLGKEDLAKINLDDYENREINIYDKIVIK